MTEELIGGRTDGLLIGERLWRGVVCHWNGESWRVCEAVTKGAIKCPFSRRTMQIFHPGDFVLEREEEGYLVAVAMSQDDFNARVQVVA